MRLGPLLLLSCSATTSVAPVDGGADVATIRVPKNHRAAAVSCPATRDPGHADSTMGTCKADGDCTAGRNGRCYGGLGPNTCSYDECATDADCKAAVCDCRNVGVIGQPDKCILGNCRTDGDCKGQYCSPSGTTVGAGCMGAELGSYGYFCHTATDECVDDSDCGDAKCMFDPAVVHFRCIKLVCPR